MIINITTIDEISDFVYTFVGDISFSDPMLRTEEQFAQNLTQALAHPEAHCMIGVYRKGGLTGVFSFLVNAGEGYLEMLVGLSREAAAYEEMLDYLEQKFPSYEVDFVCNPRNDLIRRALEGSSAWYGRGHPRRGTTPVRSSPMRNGTKRPILPFIGTRDGIGRRKK